MELREHEEGWNRLRAIIASFYSTRGRTLAFFSEASQCDNELGVCFLLDRKHVLKYLVGKDRGLYIGVLLLAIGPRYFSANDYWDYENYQRFRMSTDNHSVIRNLELFEEYLSQIKDER